MEAVDRLEDIKRQSDELHHGQQRDDASGPKGSRSFATVVTVSNSTVNFV